MGASVRPHRGHTSWRTPRSMGTRKRSPQCVQNWIRYSVAMVANSFQLLLINLRVTFFHKRLQGVSVTITIHWQTARSSGESMRLFQHWGKERGAADYYPDRRPATAHARRFTGRLPDGSLPSGCFARLGMSQFPVSANAWSDQVQVVDTAIVWSCFLCGNVMSSDFGGAVGHDLAPPGPLIRDIAFFQV